VPWDFSTACRAFAAGLVEKYVQPSGSLGSRALHVSTRLPSYGLPSSSDTDLAVRQYRTITRARRAWHSADRRMASTWLLPMQRGMVAGCTAVPSLEARFSFRRGSHSPQHWTCALGKFTVGSRFGTFPQTARSATEHVGAHGTGDRRSFGVAPAARAPDQRGTSLLTPTEAAVAVAGPAPPAPRCLAWRSSGSSPAAPRARAPGASRDTQKRKRRRPNVGSSPSRVVSRWRDLTAPPRTLSAGRSAGLQPVSGSVSVASWPAW